MHFIFLTTVSLFAFGNAKIVSEFSSNVIDEPNDAGRQNKATKFARMTLPLHRYHFVEKGDHFYTTSWTELEDGNDAYKYEGIACHIFPNPEDGTVPLFRYYLPYQGVFGDHYYTTNWDELGSGRRNYAFQGVQGYVFPTPMSSTVALHIYHNVGNGDHLYTTNWNELGVGGGGYVYSGIAGYVVPEARRINPVNVTNFLTNY